METETSTMSDLVAEQNALARAQRERIGRSQKAEKLSAIDGVLVCHRRALSLVEEPIHDRNT
ncbi:hypothetical protein JG688_00004679 [Phytophthora aleatoria]|uniref:Uncharacterized protein n=1 Tax=Phytophthora aleatoria TaxID=2496075 RepID=A0A8J5JDU2_9STRA|nr:hypothetical protein JG688_00004679 [Phytophthora aleatoria]